MALGKMGHCLCLIGNEATHTLLPQALVTLSSTGQLPTSPVVFLQFHRKQEENTVSPEQITEQLSPLEDQPNINSISENSQLSQKKKKRDKIMKNLKQIYILLKHIF